MKTSLFLPKVNFPLEACRSAIVFVFFLVLLGPVLPAHAATITVDSTADSTGNDGACTLREAIINANNDAQTWVDCAAGSGPDVIDIAAAGTITLASALPNLTAALTINGPGASSLAISGANAFRVFSIAGVGAYNFQNVTIANGIAMFGGGMFVQSASSVSVDNVIFSGNQESGGAGGAIYNGGMPLTVTNSTFSNNSGYGGAINNDGSAVLTVINSTFSGNTGSGHVGGTIAQIGVNGSTTLTNVTISTNDATSALYIAFGTLTLRNSIVVNNGAGASCQVVVPGTVANGGNNIDGGTACGWGSTNGSMSSSNPLLGPLTDNGGPTPTMALLTGSPAIDGVTFNAPNSAPAADQRGIARPQGARYDIGAYELEQAAVPTMTEWGMIILVIFFGATSAYYLRRGRVAA
jgi:CSLREA domain-containing protein